jgi:predicted phosphodiesterase
MGGVKLLAISDLHVAYPQNRKAVADLRPESPDDWLLIAGDVGERYADIEWALGLLAERYGTVVWTPGNHELWTMNDDPVQLRGEERYRHLVETCRRYGVHTPEDPYPVWDGPGGPVTVVPLFVLYDYTFRPDGANTKEESLAETTRRLDALDPDLPTILVNHFPLVREPTRILRYPEFAQWCGTERTADWHVRYRAATVVYGHLHIPRTIEVDGVPFVEVSVGYPREWGRRGDHPHPPRQILPAAVAP